MAELNLNPFDTLLQKPEIGVPKDLQQQVAEQIQRGILEQAQPRTAEEPKPKKDERTKAALMHYYGPGGESWIPGTFTGLKKAWDWAFGGEETPPTVPSKFKPLPNPLDIVLSKITQRYGPAGMMQTGAGGPMSIEGMDRQIPQSVLDAIAQSKEDFAKRRALLEKTYGEGKEVDEGKAGWTTGIGGLLAAGLSAAMGLPLPAIAAMGLLGAGETKRRGEQSISDFNKEAAEAYGKLGEERIAASQLYSQMLGLDAKPMAVSGGLAVPTREGDKIRWNIVRTEPTRGEKDRSRNLRYGMGQVIKLSQDPSRVLNELSQMQIPAGPDQPNIRVDELIRQIAGEVQKEAGEMGDIGLASAVSQYTSGRGFDKGDLGAARLFNAIQSHPTVHQALQQLYERYVLMGMGVGPMPAETQ